MSCARPPSQSADLHDVVVPGPAALWNSFEGDTLSITFSDVVPEGTTLCLEDDADRALTVMWVPSSSVRLIGSRVTL